VKIVIDIEDFYIDERGDIEPALKEFIIRKSVARIKESIEDRIKNQVYEEIKCLVNNLLTKEINEKIKHFILEGKTKSRKNSGIEVSIEDRLREDFEYDSGYSSMKEFVKSLAVNFSKEMKNRYDLLFASQLVAKMSNSGMLKEDVAKILLTNNE
jgi:uncharacterized protein YaaW (UPF0174 family)